MPLLLCGWLAVATVQAAEDACAPFVSDAPQDLGSLLADRPGIAFGDGLLFRVEMDGQAVSHVFGTMHLDFPQVTRMAPPVRLAFAHSKRLVLETVLDQDAHALYNDAIVLPPGERLDQHLDPDLYQRLADILVRYYRFEGDLAERLKPWAAFSVLARPRPGTGVVLDELLRQMAEAVGKPVHGLESMEELIAVLDGLSLEDQIVILSDTICNHELLMRQVRDLVRLYLRGDLAGLTALNTQLRDDEALFQRFMERLLYRRNDLMVQRMQPHLEAGGAFIAVGALHLPGERGVLAQLQTLGYRVERAY